MCCCSGSPSDGLILLTSSHHFLSTSHACATTCSMSSYCEVGFFSKRPWGLFFAFLVFFFCRATCGNLVPQPGVEPALLTLERGVVTTGPPRNSWASGLIGEWSEIEDLGTRCIITACVLATRPGLCPFPGFFTSETILPNFSLPVFFSVPP